MRCVFVSNLNNPHGGVENVLHGGSSQQILHFTTEISDSLLSDVNQGPGEYTIHIATFHILVRSRGKRSSSLAPMFCTCIKLVLNGGGSTNKLLK